MREQTGAASRLVSVSADRPQSRHEFVGSLDHDLQVYSMRSILSTHILHQNKFTHELLR
jgi:hypothetical protein